MANSEIIDHAKILSTCLVAIRHQTKRLESRIAKRIDALQIEGVDPERLKSDILESLPTPSLPDELLYEAHLDDYRAEVNWTLAQVREEIERRTQAFQDGLTEQSEASEKAFSKVDHDHDDVYSKLDHDHPDLAQKDHDHDDVYSKLDHLHDDRYVLIEKFDSVVQRVAESLGLAESQTAEWIDGLKTELVECDRAISEEVSSLTNQLLEHRDSFSQFLEENARERASLNESQQDEFGRLQEQINVLTSQDLVDLNRRLASINQKVNFKAEADHVHPDLAKVGHTHEQYAFRDDVEGLSKRTNAHDVRLNSVTKVLDSAFKEIEKKQDASTALQKSDLAALKERVTKEVLENMPLPEKGEDAKEWFFEQGEQHGILKWKREDWKHWKRVDLLGPIRTHLYDQQAEFVSGGGGGDSSELEVRHDNTLVESDTATLNFVGNIFSVENPATGIINLTLDEEKLGTGVYEGDTFVAGVSTYIDTATCDANGEWSLDYTSVGFTEIKNVQVSSEMIPGAEPFLERITRAHFDTPSTTAISGVVTVEKKATFLTGMSGFAQQAAPEGTKVHVQIIGVK